jgi:hypothetical protein
MTQLKNENGYLFSEDERLFMDFLLFRKRLVCSGRRASAAATVSRRVRNKNHCFSLNII